MVSLIGHPSLSCKKIATRRYSRVLVVFTVSTLWRIVPATGEKKDESDTAPGIWNIPGQVKSSLDGAVDSVAGAVEAAGGAVVGAGKAKAASGAVEEFHCCAATEDQRFELVCDAFDKDAIISVPFAAFGAPEVGTTVCGLEVPPTCGSSVKSVIESQCVGSRSCIVNMTQLGDPCPMAAGRRLLSIRWQCRSDSDSVWPAVANHTLPALPLRAKGSVIVDANGQRVRLKGVNWSGGHEWRYVPAGLDHAPLRSIARLIRSLGFNFVRLTFAIETWRSNPIIRGSAIAANPQLHGLSAVDILDKTIAALEKEGVLVWLDNHMLDADWCCQDSDCNGMWFNPRHSMDQWVETWADVARHFSNVHSLVGAGIKNEPRRVCNGKSWDRGATCNVSFLNETPDEKGCVSPGWADGPEQLRWRDAAERVGKAILAENPRLLVSVCGLDYCTNLTGVAAQPLDLPKQNLVYEAHEYPWFHEAYIMEQGTHRHPCKLNHSWGYILQDERAPVLMSEFGMAQDWNTTADFVKWFNAMSAYVQEEGPLADRGGMDWAYWQLSGVQVSGTSRKEGDTESFGVLNHCWTAPANAAHIAAIQRLMQPASAPVASQVSCEAVDWEGNGSNGTELNISDYPEISGQRIQKLATDIAKWYIEKPCEAPLEVGSNSTAAVPTEEEIAGKYALQSCTCDTVASEDGLDTLVVAGVVVLMLTFLGLPLLFLVLSRWLRREKEERIEHDGIALTARSRPLARSLENSQSDSN